MEKVEKLPRSALALYVKLYCERKNNRDTKYYNNLIEAKRSWLALSQQEKDKFSEQYEQYRIKIKRRFANYLRNAEPYLKKKDAPPRPRIPDTRPFEEPQPDDYRTDINTTLRLDPEEESSSINDRVYSGDVSQLEIQQATTSVEDEQYANNLQGYVQPVLVEPTPPRIINGQELFKLINRMEENDLTWSTLTSTQKKSYQAAVLSLKKDYIKKYKAYLESLSSKELFDHYNIKCS